MKSPFSSDAGSALAKNPFVLAGLAVVVLLGVTAATLVLVSSVRGSNASTPKVKIEQPTATQGPTLKTAEAGGVHGLAKDITAVRSAPGGDTPVLGTITGGTDVVIDGKTTDAGWYRVIFPQGSELHGWIDSDALTVTGDATTLVVATAEPPAVIEVPTQPPAPTAAPTEPTTPEASPTSATPGAGELPDLVVGTTPTLVGGTLVVTIVNQGKGAMTGDLVVAVFNADQTKLVGGITVPGVTIAPGASLDVNTGVAVVGDQTFTIVADPNGTVDETDNTNNRITIQVTTGESPTPTAVVPLPAPPPP